jgi:hypothetical protein
MSATPIFDRLKEEAEDDRLRELMGDNYDCAACYLGAKGWGGWGCCEICDQSGADHTCEQPA